MYQIYNSGTSWEKWRYRMAEVFDEYVDQLTIAAGPYGVALNFGRANPKPVAPGSVPQAQDIGTLRMSSEHFKVMTFLFKRHIDEIEKQSGVEIPIPMQLMHALKIAPEDWQAFWKHSD